MSACMTTEGNSLMGALAGCIGEGRSGQETHQGIQNLLLTVRVQVVASCIRLGLDLLCMLRFAMQPGQAISCCLHQPGGVKWHLIYARQSHGDASHSPEGKHCVQVHGTVGLGELRRRVLPGMLLVWAACAWERDQCRL